MNTKFDKLFNTIMEEAENDSFLSNNEKIASLTGTPKAVGGTVETEAKKKPEATIEEKK